MKTRWKGVEVFCLCFLIATIVSVPAMAQSTGSQNVTGIAQQQFDGSWGSTPAWSNAAGWSQGNFVGNGQNSAFGTAQANGQGSGWQTMGSTSAASGAASSVNSQASVFGDHNNMVGVAGGAAQGNGASTGSGGNYAWGGNQTAGSYNGTLTGNGPLQASGNATATGQTFVSSLHGPNSAQSSVGTFGQSAANMSIPGATGVSGYGEAAAGSMVGTPGIGNFAGGSVHGTATYNGVGSQSASGSLGITGVTSGFVGNGVVGASSTVSSAAQGSGGGSSPQPPMCGCGGGH